MSQDESGNENSINKDIENETQKSQEDPEEDENSDSHETDKQPKNLRKRSPAKTPKSHASHPVRGSPTFDSQMTQEQAEINLIKLFGNAFLDASKDSLILSDKLSVRDLRIIVRVLRLCGATQVNVRKPVLCDYLMKHMQKPRMISLFTSYNEEKEKNRAARMKSREEKAKNAEQAEQSKKSNRLERSSTSSTRSNRKDNQSTSTRHSSTAPPSPKRQSSAGNLPLSLTTSSSAESGNKSYSSQLTSVGSRSNISSVDDQRNRAGNEVVVPRLTFDSTFNVKQSLDILQKCNAFVLDVSNKLTELERAVSIMAYKISELEQYYESS